SREGGTDAAEAIMTTDTELKQCALAVTTPQGSFVLGGMAKGSGMIHPNMATMLCFLTTDAAVPAAFLQQCLRQAVDATFNQISVDGDTSTNDMVVLLANGASGVPIEPGSPQADAFQAALQQVCTELAKKIARDGEGATHLIQALVKGAPTLADARRAAKAIISSNLFKAAVFGRDANWGRIICALGYSGADFDPQRVDIYLGDVQVAADGCGLPFDEERAAQVLAREQVDVIVDFKQGEYSALAWGCDLTYEYVKINGSYRT
ncbi:MAG: bifunctional glutamate N-acetyltransferase/amino-acid acetyltransferase ArgJ, partial [Bacillota bacterium]